MTQTTQKSIPGRNWIIIDTRTGKQLPGRYDREEALWQIEGDSALRARRVREYTRKLG